MKQTELHKAMNAEDKAKKTVQDKFITMYKSENLKKAECDYLNYLKAKAKDSEKGSKAKREYTAKRYRIQKATKRPEILKELFGENPPEISIIQGKNGFEWVVVKADDTKSVPSGTETESEVIAMPKGENTKDLTMVNTEYLAEFGTTETIVNEIEQTIAMLEETLANIKAKVA